MTGSSNPGPIWQAYSDADLEAACYAVSGFITQRRRQGQGIPAEVLRLYRRLELAAMTAMSDDGPGYGSQTAPLNQELIDAHQAAEILGCTDRHVRRLARDLDGQHIARRWVFERNTVQEYEEAREHGRRTERAG